MSLNNRLVTDNLDIWTSSIKTKQCQVEEGIKIEAIWSQEITRNDSRISNKGSFRALKNLMSLQKSSWKELKLRKISFSKKEN